MADKKKEEGNSNVKAAKIGAGATISAAKIGAGATIIVAIIGVLAAFLQRQPISALPSSATESLIVTPTPPEIIAEVAEGSIASKEGLDYYIVPNSGNVDNFRLSVKFKNPYQATDVNRWDFAVGFRINDVESYYLVFDSTGGWVLHQSDKTQTRTKLNGDYGAKNIALNLGEGESNEVVLSVFNNIACFSVNGMASIRSKLSETTTSGRIELAAGYWVGNSQLGKETGFSDLVVHSISHEECP